MGSAKVNKWLLGWNIGITILLLTSIISGCSSIDPQFAALESQVKSNRAIIEQLADAVNEDRQMTQEQATSMLQLRLYTETAIQQLQQSIK